MEELFNIIGKMYVDLYHNQSLIDALQKTLKQKDEEIQKLKNGKQDDGTGN